MGRFCRLAAARPTPVNETTVRIAKQLQQPHVLFAEWSARRHIRGARNVALLARARACREQ